MKQKELVCLEKILVCLDVDGTIFLGSLHNHLYEKLRIASNLGITSSLELIMQYTDEFLSNPTLGWRNKAKLVTLIKKAWLSGYEVALVSFNDYPEAVKYAMTKILKEEVESLHIKSYFPEVLKKFYMVHPVCNKQQHIKEVMQIVGVTNPKNVLLIEDTKYNVDAAIEAGMNAVLIIPKDVEFTVAFEALRQLDLDNDLFTEPLTEPQLSDSSNDEDVNMIDNQDEGGNYKFDDGGVPILG